MKPPITFDEGTEWRRAGRGLCFTFQVPLEVVDEILKSSLPVEYAPYELIANVRRKGQANSIVRLQLNDAEKPLDCFVSQRLDLVSLWSHALTDEMDHESLTYPESSWALNGFVCIQWQSGRGLLNPTDDSDLCCTDRVMHKNGTMRDYREYRKIFAVLKARLSSATHAASSSHGQPSSK